LLSLSSPLLSGQSFRRLQIYDWNGAAADRKKREKGVEVANRLSGEKRKRTSGKAKKPGALLCVLCKRKKC